MPADLNLELRLGFLVHDVSRLRRNIIDRTLKPLGVTRSQWWVLAFLSRRDGMPQVALADELDIGKVALGGLIERLALAELVERRGDPIDKRIKRVYLTRAGAKLIRDIRGNVSDVERQIVGHIDSDALEVTVKSLRSMKENLLALLDSSDDPDIVLLPEMDRTG